ncbi:MAG: DUF1735 domain-containing protein, partial [Tannerella sp.]|nr:DUF1735 domain-containing protein [Tannerella sp.]
KKYNKYSVLALALMSFGLSSCLDEDPVFTDNGSHSIVELVLPARTSSTPYAVKITTLEFVDEILLPIEVNFTGVNGAPQDIQVTLSIDDAIIAKYDPSGETVALSPSNYEAPSPSTVTIPKGEKKATYIIKLKPRTFDQTKSYALGVKIASASGGTISGNYSAGVYSLPIKSPWQGKYDVHYKWVLRGGSKPAPEDDEEYDEEDVELTTAGPGVVQAQYVGAWFSGYTTYTFKPDGTILPFVYSGSARAVEVFSSSYDLDKLVFEVEYSFISPTNYRLIETYTRTGDLD